MPAKVWIVGEGNNELGRSDGYGGRDRGVLEALLTRVRDGGWECTGNYVDVVEQAELGEPDHFSLPAGTESLRAWLATAHEVLTRLVHGQPAL